MTAEAIDNEATQVRWEVEEVARWRRRLSIHVPTARVEQVRREAVRGFARQARLKGFRRGRAPESLIERQYGPEIDQTVVKDLVREGVEAGLDRSGLEPIDMPSIDDLHWSPEGHLEFTAEFDIHPEIEIGRATGFRIERHVRAIADTDVDRVLDRLRSERGRWDPVSRPARDGDRIVFASVQLDEAGRPLETRRIENHRVELGTGALLPDFEAGLSGLEPGAEKTITVRFPEDHPNDALQGGAHNFQIAVDAVQERALPPLDDDFARALGDFETLAAAREHIRRNLEVEVSQQTEREVNEGLIDEIIAANAIDLPASLVDRYLKTMLSDKHGPLGGRVPAERDAEVRALLRPGAERAMRRHYILNHLADRERLRPSDEEINAATAELTGMADSREDLRLHLTMERVFTWLREHSQITDIPATE